MAEAVRAAVVRASGERPQVEVVELAPTGPRQVRVRIVATGVCHSDLSMADGTLKHSMPVVLGHECTGVIAETGPGVDNLNVGDPVLLNWSPACRGCWFCQHDEPYLCQNADRAWRRPYGRLSDGTDLFPGFGVAGFAEATVVDADSCVRLPTDIPLAEAALLGCAVLTGVGAVRNSARVRPGESVVVIGLGGVGLSAVQGARMAGAAPIIVVDPSAEKADLARRLGATDAIEPGSDLAKRVRALCGGIGADHAIECVGRTATIRAAWSATRRGGRATIVGVGPVTEQVTFNALEIHHFARTLTGCVYGNSDPVADLPYLFDQYRSGALDLRGLVTSEIDLTEIGEAFDRLATGSGARSVVLLAR